MNKMHMLVVAMFVIMVANVVAVPVEKFCPVPVEKFCTDTDGSNIWTAGLTTDEKGINADDCDGASNNLKEFSCDGNKVKVDNTKCSDYGAKCVSVGDKTVADYCACDTGYAFNDNLKKCVLTANDNTDTGPVGVPEFSPITLGIGIVVLTFGLVILRKN